MRSGATWMTVGACAVVLVGVALYALGDEKGMVAQPLEAVGDDSPAEPRPDERAADRESDGRVADRESVVAREAGDLVLQVFYAGSVDRGAGLAVLARSRTVEPSRSGTTDSDGRLTFSDLPVGVWSVTVDMLYTQEATVVSGVTHLELHIPTVVPLRVKVVDPGGAACPGASVLQACGGSDAYLPVGETDEAGVLEVTRGCLPGMLFASKSGYGDSLVVPIGWDGLTKGDLVCRLREPASRLEVRVTASAGGVVGASVSVREVLLWRAVGRGVRPRVSLATTDEAGEVQFASLIPGTYTLTVRVDHLADCTRTIEVAASGEPQVEIVELDEGFSVSGTVTREEGGPAVGGYVVARGPTFVAAELDAGGSYLLPHIAPGSYVLEVQVQGVAQPLATHGIVGARGDRLAWDPTLPARGSLLQGRVVNASGVAVFSKRLIVVAVNDGPAGWETSVGVAPDGGFELAVPPELHWTVGLIDPTRSNVWLCRIDDVPSGTMGLSLVAPKLGDDGASIGGRVRGLPEGVSVLAVACRLDETNQYSRPEPVGGAWSRVAPDGHFRVGGLRAGEYCMWIVNPSGHAFEGARVKVDEGAHEDVGWVDYEEQGQLAIELTVEPGDGVASDVYVGVIDANGVRVAERRVPSVDERGTRVNLPVPGGELHVMVNSRTHRAEEQTVFVAAGGDGIVSMLMSKRAVPIPDPPKRGDR